LCIGVNFFGLISGSQIVWRLYGVILSALVFFPKPNICQNRQVNAN